MSEGYQLDVIDGQNNWTTPAAGIFSDMFIISDEQASNGNYSLRLGLDEMEMIPPTSIIGPYWDISDEVPGELEVFEVSADLYFGSTAGGEGELDFYVYGENGTDAMPGAILSFSNQEISMINLDDFTIGGEKEVPNDEFISVKIQFDFINHKTRFYVSDELIFTGGIFLNTITAYGFLTRGENIGYVDNIKTTINPDLGIDPFKNSNFFYFVNDNKLILSNNINMDKVSIYNLNGRLIHNQNIQDTNATIGIEKLNAGIYIAKISTNGNHKTFKFVKN